jgi:hypothetical protein
MSRQNPDPDEQWALRKFPGLAGRFDKTSLQSDDYNCLAWALGLTGTWIDPFDHRTTPGKSWPDGIPEEWSIPATRQIFERDGYTEETKNQDLEPDWEKVAIFSNNRDELHFARQLPNGKWTSKLGTQIDIEHDDLESLKGNTYGEWRVILKRRKRE